METTTLRRWERRIVVDAIVHHPVDEVFSYLSDPTRWHDFVPAVEFRKQIDPGPPRVGTRWMATDRIGPFRLHFIDRLELLDDNRRVVWLSSAPWNSRVEYACESSDTGTRVRAEYVGVLSGSARWQLGWLPAWACHLILAQDFRRLDRLLTRQIRASARWRLRRRVTVDGMAVFSPEVVAAVLHHMNDDHIDDNVLIVRAFADREVGDATMHDLDEHGGTWHYAFEGEQQELHIPWPGAPLSERAEIRRDIVALYDAACEKLGVEARPH